MSYKRVELHEGAQVQFVGIYATRWPYESGVEPTVGFIEIDDDEADREAAELRAANSTLEQHVRELTAERNELKNDLTYERALHNRTADHLGVEIMRRESAQRGLALMNQRYSEAMTRLSKYEKVTA